MGLSWDYLYNPRSDSWEVQSNEAFSTKEVAEELLKQNQKSAEDIEKIKNWNKHCESDYSARHEEVSRVNKENQQLKEELDILKNNKAHIPELAFRNGKAYCKKCGSDLE